MRLPRIILSAAIVLCCCARSEDEAKLPLLDIVATAKLNTPKEHMANYASAIEGELRNVFRGLIRRQRGKVEAPRDGDALYRLAVDISGSVTIGSAITSVAGRPERADALNKGAIDNDQWFRTFFIEGRQQITAQCKLLKWENGKYQEVLKWTATPVKRPEEEKMNGQIEIGRTQGRHSQQKDAGLPPMTLPQAQQVAVSMLMPASLADGVLSKLVEVKVVKAQPNKDAPGEISADLSIINKSPWPVKRIEMMLANTGKLYSLGEKARIQNGPQNIEFAEALKPGQDIRLTVPGKEFKDKAKPGMREVEFEVTQPAEQ